jgi:DNA polymerase II small subunit/DNA polymerase delta subunit B
MDMVSHFKNRKDNLKKAITDKENRTDMEEELQKELPKVLQS